MENQNPAQTASASTASVKAEKNKLMAVLSYIGPLVIVSYLTAKEDPFVKFHIKQGLVLFVAEVVLWFLGSMMFYQLWALLNLIHLGLVVFSIIGIVNAFQGKEQELPIIGQYAKHFPL